MRTIADGRTKLETVEDVELMAHHHRSIYPVFRNNKPTPAAFVMQFPCALVLNMLRCGAGLFVYQKPEKPK